jgi:hypothetical protein
LFARVSIRAACLLGFLMLGGASAKVVDETAAVFPIQRTFFDCAPKVLRAGQSLTLTMGPVHGRHLAVEHVGEEHWYYLVMDPRPQFGPYIMAPGAFAKARRVVIPANIIADHWGKSERVFTKPGKYILYTSDNLESEDPGYRCEIRYAG